MANVKFWGDPVKYDFGDITDSGGRSDPNWEASLPGWNVWDTAYVAGLRVPGLVRVRGRREQRIDKKVSPGVDAATPTMLGFHPLQVEMTIRMWTPVQFTAFQYLISTLQVVIQKAKAQPKGAPINSAVEVIHPSLQVVGISKLYLKSFTLLEPAGNPGEMQSTFVFEEFNPQKSGNVRTMTGALDFTTPPNVYGTSVQVQPVNSVPPHQNPVTLGP